MDNKDKSDFQFLEDLTHALAVLDLHGNERQTEHILDEAHL